ncbi:hybrid sensor histidine kinase/response regulator transcription factor [Pedobacter sp. B4-66]|uniref:hybrid sensor histidine kinase/response regulator transcription factor n=1 Tax=Pedobacter sp. B4-66 TaxID=2817280 RepID=UPI001BDAA4BC|nr:hybrid sensor histidine kinase/response regulator transcription factor [Pedobacter sp. B4-66]
MGKKLKILILLGLCLFASVSTFAQYNQYQFSHLDINNGLPHNDVNCFYKDDKGFLWLGTLSGLARFDGYSFKVYKNRTKNKSTISDSDVRSIVQGPDRKFFIETRAGMDLYDPVTELFDHNIQPQLSKYGVPGMTIRALKKGNSGRFWFISPSSGLYKYDTVSKKTTYVAHKVRKESSLSASPIIDLAEDKEGNAWLIHSDGKLEMLKKNSDVVAQRIDLSSKFSNKESDTYKIFIDKQGLIWIYDISTSTGVYYFDPVKNELNKISKNSPVVKLNSDIVTGIIQDNSDNIWIGTDHGGINLIDKKNFSIRYILNNENDSKSLSQNSISSIYYDDLGMVWIGTFRKGINFYHPNIIKFNLIKHSSDPNSLIHSDVNRMVEDKAGNIWIGTNGKGLVYYNRSTHKFTSYRHDPADNNSLSHDAIVAIYIDRFEKLWIGTYTGGFDYLDNGKFTHYKYNASDPESLSDNKVADFLEDSSHRFWIGTMGGGLNLFDRTTKKFKRYTQNLNLISSDYVFKVLEDSHQNIWTGTSYGMNVLPKGGTKFIRIINDPKDDNSLINNNINSFIEDSKGYLWIGTRDGLSIYNLKTKTFFNYTIENGLPDNNIMDIQEDNQGDFWVSTSNGLSKISVKYGNKLNLVFKNFDENDGLQGKEFNRIASVKLKTGELAFGGPDGINIFQPSLIKSYNQTFKLFITDFQLFNKSVTANTAFDGRIILKKSIFDTKEITLDHDQNVFTIEFASLNYIGPHKVKHQYMLEGFDKTWISADNTLRRATYTNLDPGDYVFKVRASSTENIADAVPVTLKIRILNPWYTSTVAYILYFLAIGGALYYLRYRGIQKLKQQFAAEQEKLEVQRLIEQEKIESQRLLDNERLEAMRYRDLDAMKIKFLTNVSHEFRTPLSLILAPIDKILKGTSDNLIKEQVALIQKNAKRLLNLVNQLLDFRKMELKEIKLQKRPGDIISFIRDITYSFKDLAEQKNILLTFNATYEKLDVNFDHDKIERILFNLLSNSFKFTLDNGKVNVSVDCIMVDQYMVEIKVRDTGIGIPKEKQDKIFESFFQNDIPESIINQGSGIGLAITKEFVKLHGGEIFLESDENVGSCFTILLPFEELRNQSNTTDSFVDNVIVDEDALNGQQANVTISSKKATVLLVEDDADLRFYLKDNLKEDFNVIEAGNGKDGWQKALFYHPNIIVSDISMPEMSGIELCKKIKGDSRTTQIPVVLLTALTGEEQELMGLETGANDYMTKPFSFEILNSKIRNILVQQESFRKLYQKQVEVQPATVEMESPDEQFLQQVLQEIEKNIDNSNFSVDILSSLMLVSRVTLYKRIVALTGKTPLEFIKSYRLKRAAQLLEQGKLTVSQICYKVGFKTTKNFVKSFKEEFDVLPSKYTENKDINA